jgi:hypothetical protein
MQHKAAPNGIKRRAVARQSIPKAASFKPKIIITRIASEMESMFARLAALFARSSSSIFFSSVM